MKKQLKRLKGKRLITGDTNLMTKHEICINTTSDGKVEVKELGTDGKIKDLTGGSSKEYDDLNTFLYYDDRIISEGGVELPLCALIASILLTLQQYYPNLNVIVKVNNSEDSLGMNLGNYIPLEFLLGGSGSVELILPLLNGISIPKYLLPESAIYSSGELVPPEIDKLNIFDAMIILLGGESVRGIVEYIKTQPTITREEFFDLLK